MTHPKLLKALEEIEAYKLEEKQLNEMVLECISCENCEDLDSHIKSCTHNTL